MGAALIAVASRKTELFSYEALAIAWFAYPELTVKGETIPELKKHLLAVERTMGTSARNAIASAAHRAGERLIHREYIKPTNRHSIEVLLEHPVVLKELIYDHKEAKDHYLVKLAQKILKEKA